MVVVCAKWLSCDCPVCARAQISGQQSILPPDVPDHWSSTLSDFFSHFQTLCKKSSCNAKFSKDKFLQENAAADKFYHKTVATFYLFGSNSGEQVTRCKVVHQKDWKGFQEQMRRQLEPAVSEYLVSKFQPKQPLSRVLEHFIHGEKRHQMWIGRGNLHSVRVIIITCNTRLQKIIQNHQLTDGK